MKNKGLWIGLGVVVLIGFFLMSSYNGLVGKDEAINGQWAQVEASYQRRSDLIPNLVNTVKGYADFEQETLTKVIEARSKATSIQVDPSNLSPEAIGNFQKAQDGLSGALSRLLVTIERYPDLKANQNFRDLQAELTNTENKIAFERNKFNRVVQEFNGKIRRFPTNVIGSLFGFEKRGYFESDEGSEKAPEVQF
jgi:LemA protein